jgi:hypothetical protein
MSLAPIVVDSGALGWGLALLTRSGGSGEAKVSWDAPASRNRDFALGIGSPELALEEVYLRVQKNGAVSPLDVPVLVGILVGHFQTRA